MELAEDLIRVDNNLHRKELLKQALSDSNYWIYVVELDQHIVGFIDVRVFPDFVENNLIRIIQNIVVKEGFRQRGIGSQLLKRVIEDVERQHVVELHVWTEFDNQHTINLYMKHGLKRYALFINLYMKHGLKRYALLLEKAFNESQLTYVRWLFQFYTSHYMFIIVDLLSSSSLII